MCDLNLFNELFDENQIYVLRDQHYLTKVSKDDTIHLLSDESAFVDTNRSGSNERDFAVNNFLTLLNTKFKSTDVVNLVFSGISHNSALFEMENWLSTIISKFANHRDCFRFNERLKCLHDIVDWFLTPFSVSGMEDRSSCLIKHTLCFAEPNQMSTNQARVMWFDRSLVSRGTDNLSTFKIFYIVAIGSDNPVVSCSTASLLDKRFLTKDVVEHSKSEMKKVTILLKKLQFSETAVREIFEIISAIIELSQYRCEGSNKRLEFTGQRHFQMAANYLKVKEGHLKDFLIREHCWIDNKKKLKNPQKINNEIHSFLVILYDILIKIIFDKYNKIEIKEKKYFLHILHGLNTPNFDQGQTYCYGDYERYNVASAFHGTIGNLIENKLKNLLEFQKSIRVRQIDETSINNANQKLTETVSTIITELGMSRKEMDYLKKLEKSKLKSVKFSRTGEGVKLKLFIPMSNCFVNFDWNSFSTNSEEYNTKEMTSLMSFSLNSLLSNFKMELQTNVGITLKELSDIISLNKLLSIDTFFVHVLIVSDRNAKITDDAQIFPLNLDYLLVDQLNMDLLLLEEFIVKYRPLMLNFNESISDPITVAMRAIKRFQLTNAWCCKTFIHLEKDHIRLLNESLDNYEKNVRKIQGYSRIIIAKIQLKALKRMAGIYSLDYLDGMETIKIITNNFFSEYNPIYLCDLENIDRLILNHTLPSIDDVPIIKTLPFDWLRVSIMTGQKMLHSQSFSNEKVCIYLSKSDISQNSSCLNLNSILPENVLSNTDYFPFALKIFHQPSKDVTISLKIDQQHAIQAWNVITDINRKQNSHLSQSHGMMRGTKEYRCYNNEYLIKKLANCIINRIPYEFTDFIRECSTVLIIKSDSAYPNNLSKSPLWVVLTNCTPLASLSSEETYRLVENEIQTIDKTQCSSLIVTPSVRPKTDWLIQDVALELLIIGMEKDIDEIEARLSGSIRWTSIIEVKRPSRNEREWSKENYKIRKYNRLNRKK